MSAMKEGYGPAFTKVFQDMNNCLVSSRAEIRRRRPDLSSNVPDQSTMMKNISESKWIRYYTVRVKTGHNNDFEENIKLLKTAFEKQPSRNPILVSQAAVGQVNGTYYVASFWKSLADMDSQVVSLRDLLGSDFERYQKGTAEHTISSEWSIARISPELSNPPKEIADANPDFWKPKPAAAAKPKAKATPSEKPGT
jgi:hypothetical protein